MVNRITSYRVTEHAREEMTRRQITEAEIAQVLTAPEQIILAREGRYIFQSRIVAGEPLRSYLLRIFVDADRNPAEVVTVYRTSKIEKYWRTEL